MVWRAWPSRAEPSRVGCRRPDRRFRARPSLLAALALLLGALSPFAAAPAEAQTPAAPTNLRVVATGDGTLTLQWTVPSGMLTGYDLHYTSSTTVSDTAAASGSDASAAWVAATAPPADGDSQSIIGLTNGTRYRVRVRAENSSGAGAWAFTAGTPGVFLQWPSATYSQDESNTTAHQARLRAARASRDISGTLSYATGATNGASLSDDLQSGYATSFTARRLTDWVDVTVALPVNDTVNEEHETFTVKINSGTGYLVGTPATLTVTITDNDPPAAPSPSLTAGIGAGKLRASWTKPTGPVTGYELRYKQTTAPDQNPTRPNDPATGWVRQQSITTTTADISGLTSGTDYHVQVRATDGQTGTGNGWSAWSASQTGTSPSNDARLKVGPIAGALTATSSTSASGTFTAVALSLSGGTLRGTVANSHTHAKITPTVNHSSATVKVGKQGTTLATVTSGTASGAIPLVVGANTIEVVVTAEDGVSTQTYTVVLTRQQAQAQSSDATLSGLTATTSTSASGSFTSLNIGTFAASTTSYTATVANSRTHAKLTPTVNHSSATVTVAGTAVSSGSASGAIALSVGSNAITVRVTAEDGTTTKDYTVTITRQAVQSSNANLSGLTASTSTSATGSFSTLTLTPSTFAATTTSYTATVAGARTHAKLTPTVAHSQATVTVQGTTVSSGSPSGAIALSVGSNAITVQVTAQDGTTKDYTVTITRQSANANLSGLTASTSTSSGGTFTALNIGTFAASTTSYAATVAFARTHAKLTPTVAHSAATVTVQGTTVSSGSASGALALSVGANALRVRVTAQDSTTKTYTVTITRQAQEALPAVSLSASPASVTEGSSVTVTATLTKPHSSALTIPVTITDNTAESTDHGTLTSITINSGATSSTGTITTNQDDDAEDETFTVRLGNLPSAVVAGTPNSVQVTIRDDETSVSLSASPNPVDEGSPVTVTATLSTAASESSVTIPVTITDNTAESTDHGTLTSITISPGDTSGTGTITTNQDDDTEDETFTVALGALPASVGAGTPNSVQVTIRDDDGGGDPPDPPEPPDPPDPPDPPASAPTVRLSASPNPVDEGSSVTVTARLSSALERAVTIPLKLTAGSAERGDFGELEGITIKAGATSGTGRVSTTADADRDDETFTVALGALPSSVRAGRPSSVTVTIRDTTPENEPPAFEHSSYTFELRENADGSQRTVVLGHVQAEDPDGDAVTYDLLSGESRERFRLGRNDGAVNYIGPGEDYEAEPNRYELTVRARDPHGAEARARVVVEVVNVNEPPEAEDDEAATNEDQAVAVAVLANDTDPDGDGLRVESVSAAGHGTARIASDGGVQYTPAPDYHGMDRFTYVVADGDGLTATAAVEVTIAPVNDAPSAVGVIPDQTLDERGDASDLDVGQYFEDIDGDVLSYRASSSDPRIALTAVAGSVLTLTPIEYGSTAVTVTAEDPDGLTAEQTFTVGVSDRLARGVVWQTLAAMARSHLASARMTLARRASSNAADGASHLTVLGRSVPLDSRAAHSAAAQLLSGWTAGGGGPGLAPGTGLGAAGMGAAAPPGSARMASGSGGFIPGGAVSLVPSGAGGFDPLGGFAGGMDPLRGSQFQVVLDGGQGVLDWVGRQRWLAWLDRQWQVWGQGDVQTFAGAPSSATGYEGDVRTGYVGVDTPLSEQWLAGVAVSRSFGGGDWRAGGTRGALSTRLTTAYPYVRWSDGPNSAWATLGGGRGTAENRRETGRAGASDLGLRLGLVEMRRAVDPVYGMDVAIRADVAWAQLRTGAGEETIDAQSAGVNQVRAGAEVSRRPLRWDNGLSLSPFGELHVRRDGGAGQTGAGLEVVAGSRLTYRRVRLDAQGRLLALHSASGYRERGVGVTLGVGSQDRTGLSLSVSPRLGDAATGGGTLWQEQVYRRYVPEAMGDAWAVDARGEYGVRLRTGGLLTWFGSLSQSAYGKRFAVGGRVGMFSPGQ